VCDEIKKTIASSIALGGFILAFVLLNTDFGFESSVLPQNVPVGTSVGQRAPDFQGQILDGEIIRLSDLKGKIVVLNEFASWCAPCRAETPYLVIASQTNHDGVVFVGLNVLEGSGAVRSYQDEFQVPYPLVLDPQGKITGIYKPVGIPTSWFIDEEGIVRYVHSGPMSEEMIQKVLDEIISGIQHPNITSHLQARWLNLGINDD
jgi:peroxiredoxin